MKNLKQLLIQPFPAIRLSTAIFILIVALVGFADATYLSVEHFRGVIPPCTITSGCDDVLTSSYSVILGIPVSLLGSLFYLAILIGTFAYLESKNSKLIKWALLMTIPGFIFSLWFTYVQVFIIGSYCIYCLGSALTSTILFVTSMYIFSIPKNQDQ